MQRLSPEQPRLPPGWGRTASTGSLRYIGPPPGVVIFPKACYETYVAQQVEERRRRFRSGTFLYVRDFLKRF